MTSFLAERYLSVPPTRHAVTALVDNDRAAANAMAIRHILTIYVPADETCFTLFAAPSAELITETSRRFRLGYKRVLLVIAVGSAEPGDRS